MNQKVTRKNEEMWENIKVVVLVLNFVVDAVMSIMGYGLELRKYDDQKAQDEQIQEDREKEKAPKIDVALGHNIEMRGTKFQKIYLTNINKNVDISRGNFNVEYFVSVKRNDEIVENYHWKDMFYEQEADYEEMLDGSVLLIREDFEDFPEKTRRVWTEKAQEKESGQQETMEFQPYMCIYYKYVSNGEAADGYYVVEFDYDQCGAVKTIENPEIYYHGTEAEEQNIL